MDSPFDRTARSDAREKTPDRDPGITRSRCCAHRTSELPAARPGYHHRSRSSRNFEMSARSFVGNHRNDWEEIMRTAAFPFSSLCRILWPGPPQCRPRHRSGFTRLPAAIKIPSSRRSELGYNPFSLEKRWTRGSTPRVTKSERIQSIEIRSNAASAASELLCCC
jgi:hypothetical protein